MLQGADVPAKDETRATIAFVFDEICKLLHPFMPFLTEELWAIKGEDGPPRDERPGARALAAARRPRSTPDAEAEIGWVVDLVDEVRSARSETNVPAGAQIPLVLVAPSAEVRARADALGRHASSASRGCRTIAFADAAPKSSVQLVVRGEVAALPLEGIVDLAAERARLDEGDRRSSTADVAKIDAKLGNADFLTRAPEEVVEEQRERRRKTLARKAKMEEALRRLSDM